MRKTYVSTLALILGLAFVMAPIGVFAGNSCGGDKAGAIGTPGATGTTSANASTVGAKYTGADKACSTADKAACGVKAGTTSAGVDKAETTAKFASASFKVTGMTCGACENKVTSALKNSAGVKSVDKVDYKTGTALVTYDASAVSCPTKLAQAITDAGFAAEVVPAMATSADAKTVNVNAQACNPADMAACAAKCANMTEAERAACAAKCPAMTGTTSNSETKTETKTDGSM